MKSLTILIAFAVAMSAATTRPQTPDAAAAQAGRYVIAGTIVSAKSGQPIEGAQVTLLTARDRNQVGEVLSDAEGRFSFGNVGSGNFELRASRRGYVGAAYQEHDSGIFTGIITGEGLVTTGLRMTLQTPAVIYGTVVEDSGDPVPGAQLSLYRKDNRRGTGKMVRAGQTVADEKGNYEFAQLTAGSYFLCATGRPWYETQQEPPRNAKGEITGEAPRSALDVAYAMSCYPGTTDSNSAEAIALQPGDRVQAVVTMHAVPSTRITVHESGGASSPRFLIPTLSTEVFGLREVVQPGRLSMRGDGRPLSDSDSVEIEGVAPGQYDVELRGNSDAASVAGRIDAGGGDVSVNLSGAAPMASVSGKVAMADGSELPGQLTVFLSSQDGDPGGGVAVALNGSFRMPAVRAGEYGFLVADASVPVGVSRLTAKGAEVHGHALKIGNDPVVVTATLSEAEAVVSGFAKADGKGMAGAFLLMIPARMDGSRDGWSSDQSDSDGSFEFRNVMPGEYTLVAIREGWTLEWSRAEVIAPYLAKGVKVTVPVHAKAVKINGAVEVQEKLGPG